MSKRMGLSSARARTNASSPHSYQSTAWCTAERRYGLAARARRPSDFLFTLVLPGRWRRGRTKIACLQNLLDRMLRTGVLGIDGLASRKALILAVIEPNPVFTQAPA